MRRFINERYLVEISFVLAAAIATVIILIFFRFDFNLFEKMYPTIIAFITTLFVWNHKFKTAKKGRIRGVIISLISLLIFALIIQIPPLTHIEYYFQSVIQMTLMIFLFASLPCIVVGYITGRILEKKLGKEKAW